MLWSIMRWAVAGFCWYPFGCWVLPLLPPLMLCQYSVWCLLYITHCSINRTGRKKFLYWTDAKSHSWVSASRSMPPASAFRHPVSQSGTRAFRYRTGSPSSGIGLVPVSAFSFILVPDWPDAGKSDISAFKKGIRPSRLYCWLWKVIHPACPFCWLWIVSPSTFSCQRSAVRCLYN